MIAKYFEVQDLFQALVMYHRHPHDQGTIPAIYLLQMAASNETSKNKNLSYAFLIRRFCASKILDLFNTHYLYLNNIRNGLLT